MPQNLPTAQGQTPCGNCLFLREFVVDLSFIREALP